jgi:hypothetical protein
MTANPPPAHERRLYVSWREPSGTIHPVGLLIRREEGADERYMFSYLKLAERLDEFMPLPGLPELHERYESNELFPVFANRLMPRSRPEFDALAARADLSGDADPFEVMARTGGRRATDRIEVFAGPERTAEGRSTCLFFVRGIRHVEGAEGVIPSLHPGDHLAVVDDAENEFNPRAVLIDATDGRRIGWLPDYLVDHVHDLRLLNGSDPVVVVEHVNDDRTPPHLRLLCRLEAPWPDGYEPFSDAVFQPLVDVERR